MATDGRHTYTPEQRKQALALYRENGPGEASKQAGIPKRHYPLVGPAQWPDEPSC